MSDPETQKITGVIARLIHLDKNMSTSVFQRYSGASLRRTYSDIFACLRTCLLLCSLYLSISPTRARKYIYLYLYLFYTPAYTQETLVSTSVLRIFMKLKEKPTRPDKKSETKGAPSWMGQPWKK